MSAFRPPSTSPDGDVTRCLIFDKQPPALRHDSLDKNTIEACPRRPYSKSIVLYRIERRDYSDPDYWDTKPAAVDSGLLRRASVEPDKPLSWHPALRVSTLQMVNPAPLCRDWWSRLLGVPTAWKTPFTRSVPKTCRPGRTGQKGEHLRDDPMSRRLSPIDRISTVPQCRYSNRPSFLATDGAPHLPPRDASRSDRSSRVTGPRGQIERLAAIANGDSRNRRRRFFGCRFKVSVHPTVSSSWAKIQRPSSTNDLCGRRPPGWSSPFPQTQSDSCFLTAEGGNVRARTMRAHLSPKRPWPRRTANNVHLPRMRPVRLPVPLSVTCRSKIMRR